ncbi:hypothetical protein FIU87_09155 [Bacillus sp. THAF10]|uniref:YicC/YloC family endoribonuclease n=1 Tax=Bacillus sp. THAF10 TaxID=2587848 RepID=UPI0012681C4C|nr:YicC/YloC family endoribonuclease [Bacillus sp. THAF10]QFT88812.1 hypothetical protein FIU87_09155 [Bacillus sp. THAF10]
MVKSMTGFGHSEASYDNVKIVVEMKSVNHRFCEIIVRMPKQFMLLEEKIKKEVASIIQRGRVEIFITTEGGLSGKQLSVDWDLLGMYIEEIQEMKNRYNISGSIEVSDILKIEELFVLSQSEKLISELETPLLEQVRTAAEQLLKMRQIEGEALREDVQVHLDKIEDDADSIKQLAPSVALAYRERLEKRLKEYLESQIDEQRILAEAAIFSEKADINEELSRIHSHLEQCRQCLFISEPVGRKLDFLTQELNREINTIGSKANDAKIASFVVDMKASLEKIKEQVQNIE